MGICQKASSPLASPLHIVTKKDDSLRPCGDYRRLNMATEPNHYPLPNIADVTTYLHGAKIFSKLNLLKGYYQVPMYPDDIPKTAITTPFDTYTFNYSCFGLRNAGATFQRMMDTVLGDLPFCVAYVDDILVFSSTTEEQWRHIHLLLELLRSTGLILRHDKCIFRANHITYTGILPLQEKVTAVRAFPTPTTMKALQEFVGMVNYYHRFLPHIAATMAPLYAALTENPRPSPGHLCMLPPSTKQRGHSPTPPTSASRCLVFPSSFPPMQATSPSVPSSNKSSTAANNLSPSSARNSRRPSLDIPPSIGNYSLSTPPSVTSVISLKGHPSPSRQTTCSSSTPSPRSWTLILPVNSVICL